MANSRIAARNDYWREYFRTADVNIFDIIEGAIMLAAFDCPKEFDIRRDGIVNILHTCKLTMKCSACDKEQFAVPVDDLSSDDDDDDDLDRGLDEGIKYKSTLSDADGNRSKSSSKVINSSGNNDDDDDVDNDHDNENDDDHHHHVQLNENNNQVSNYSYRDAEALTDEIEQEAQNFDEVMRIKEIIDNSPDESVSDLCNSLRKLQLMAISVETLKTTEIGKSVNLIVKHSSKPVRQIARSLIKSWKSMVDEWMKIRSKTTVSEATPESMNPSGLDEEEGLPSPPLDDLAFLNPHSMSLEFSEFFDGVDDYGNPRKGKESKKNGESGEKPAVEKQNETKWKKPKPIVAPKENHDSVTKKPTPVKPTKPPVADITSQRQMKPNTERKFQTPEKPTFPKTPVAPQQRKQKPKISDEESEREKLEASKRKLQERYQQVENAKRQRTIQVMELHDLPKQSIAPKNQHMRGGNNHNRNWAHGRC